MNNPYSSVGRRVSAPNTDFYGNFSASPVASNPYTKVLPDGFIDETVGDELAAGAMGEEAAVGAASGGGAAAAGSAATMNPYIMAGALALQAYSANQKQKQEFAIAKQQGMLQAAKQGAEAFDRIRNLV